MFYILILRFELKDLIARLGEIPQCIGGEMTVVRRRHFVSMSLRRLKMAEKRQEKRTGQAGYTGAESRGKEDQSQTKTLVVLATDCAGKGDDELGRRIVTNFVKTLGEMGNDLWRLALLNGGVKLAVEGSVVLPELQELAGEGIGILVCGRCLETFNLQDKKRVGDATNMLDIVTSMQVAEKVISIT